MTQIHLVRHGKAAAGFGSHKDPGLDELGRRQAQAVAAMLHERHADDRPILYSSPLARAMETSQPLAAEWNCQVGSNLVLPKYPHLPRTCSNAPNGFRMPCKVTGRR